MRIMTIREPRDVWLRRRSWYQGTLGSIYINRDKNKKQDPLILNVELAIEISNLLVCEC